MYAVEKLSSYITRGVYTVSGPFHPFGGAVDIIVVQQQDGSFKTSPWYVRFGKFQGVLKAKEKVVSISVNGVEAGFHMYLDHKGEAYFLRESDAEEGDLIVSPTSSGDETDEKMLNGRFKNIQSCDFDAARRQPISQMDVGNGKIVKRTSSRRSTIFGLMFGRKPMKDNDQGSIVERVNSLERAEIAADLLEAKWSTNLPTNDRRPKNSPGKQSEGDNKDANAIDKEQCPHIPSNKVSDHDEMINSHCKNLDDNFWSSTVSENHLDEIIKHDSPCIRVDEEVIEIYTSENSNVAERSELVFDEVAPESKDPDANSQSHGTFKDSTDSCSEILGDSFGNDMKHFEEINSCEKVVEIYTLETGNTADKSKVISELVRIESNQTDVQSSGSVALSHDTVMPLNEICKGSTNDFSSVLDNEEKKTTSFSYCETLENSTLKFNVSNGRALDAVGLFSGGVGQGEKTSEVQCGTSELIPAVRLEQESGACTSKQNLSGCHDQNLEISRVEVSSVPQNNQSDCPDNADSPPVVASVRTLNGLHSSPGGVIKVEEAGNNQIDYFGNETQMEEGETTDCIQIQRLDSTDQVEKLENVGKGVSVNESCNSNGVNNAQEYGVASRSVEVTIASALSAEGSEDDQFPFSDTDSFAAKEIGPELSLDDTTVETEDHQMVSAEAGVKEHELKDIENEQSFEGFSDVSRPHTSPITIPGSRANESGNEQLARSLPNMRSGIHDLEGSNIPHPLSCSLNSKSTNAVLDVLEKKCPNSSKADSQHGGEQGQVTPELVATDIDVDNKGEQRGTLINPAVELSLCKHLLFEGMGADAARQVFNSEKVNLEKFCALGPSLVKNDKLVIRIGDHYYPWDAAAPIILGMVSFGQEQIFKTQGMIPVDWDDKNIKGDNSRAIVPTGVSWRLWPFNFKRSRTISTVHAAHEGFNELGRDSASVKTKSLTGENDMLKVRSMKKKVQSLTPTSEQLASLNLKEGRNVITFSFSTAMLGRQQVDASIYLWKWNTRIVISDVDGTITRSDVLGQFMPLVGVDWSQTGVAHLFSAIKENGYQLLFLSARAISQAHLTRQFLFNLKQDGKVLPDGPVVISPDGLFPSLYREVIRRAPHEFKISCLEEIRALFPPDCNPFYAGFGNRDTDEISYLKVGIPVGKIFIINPKGKVTVNRRVDTKSYTSLHALVNGMFPPMSSAEQEDYNSWNYWKLPLPEVDV
ncbi:phosphatidate phosphatase PAH2-like isoform X1 [Phoenix dactylifera]|uniref:phosphatidate phosphatase n=1 Tax=Phoenix dactylifera TaxID=42345 RepID=A0A8B7CS30_PHODC|nr:phosphatidate phosphatase PAH2-like isoform X1 [Phoenix dactylifera]XP_008805260.2 phosphatidate phosphatase PAH2-like isoform X1 [Phoenix dactylifera]